MGEIVHRYYLIMKMSWNLLLTWYVVNVFKGVGFCYLMIRLYILFLYNVMKSMKNLTSE